MGHKDVEQPSLFPQDSSTGESQKVLQKQPTVETKHRQYWQSLMSLPTRSEKQIGAARQCCDDITEHILQALKHDEAYGTTDVKKSMAAPARTDDKNSTVRSNDVSCNDDNSSSVHRDNVVGGQQEETPLDNSGIPSYERFEAPLFAGQE